MTPNPLPPAPEPAATRVAAVGSWGIFAGGLAAILLGTGGALLTAARGDLALGDYQQHLALIVGGIGVLCPGLNRYKVGAFARE